MTPCRLMMTGLSSSHYQAPNDSLPTFLSHFKDKSPGGCDRLTRAACTHGLTSPPVAMTARPFEQLLTRFSRSPGGCDTACAHGLDLPSSRDDSPAFRATSPEQSAWSCLSLTAFHPRGMTAAAPSRHLQPSNFSPNCFIQHLVAWLSTAKSPFSPKAIAVCANVGSKSPRKTWTRMATTSKKQFSA